MIGVVLKEKLLRRGATVVGLASVEAALSDEIRHLPRAVSIGLRADLHERNLRRLTALLKEAASFLRSRGHRILCIPPDSDRITGTFVSRLYPLLTHKVAATSSGLGWIGRNGLLISPDYGPRLSLATVLTDAPFAVDRPLAESRCGACRLCVDHCPSDALTGEEWSREHPFPVLVRTDRCRLHKGSRRSVHERPNCGLCRNICPYGRPAGLRKAG